MTTADGPWFARCWTLGTWDLHVWLYIENMCMYLTVHCKYTCAENKTLESGHSVGREAEGSRSRNISSVQSSIEQTCILKTAFGSYSPLDQTLHKAVMVSIWVCHPCIETHLFLVNLPIPYIVNIKGTSLKICKTQWGLYSFSPHSPSDSVLSDLFGLCLYQRINAKSSIITFGFIVFVVDISDMLHKDHWDNLSEDNVVITEIFHFCRKSILLTS